MSKIVTNAQDLEAISYNASTGLTINTQLNTQTINTSNSAIVYKSTGYPDWYTTNYNGNFYLNYNNSDKIKLDTSGNIVLMGGGGIDFGGHTPDGPSPSSALLDDYEEGAWTPSISGATYYNNGCTYTKIGRLVYCKFRVQVTSAQTEVKIYGIPFASVDGDSGQGTCLATRVNSNVCVLANSDHIWIQNTSDYDYLYGFVIYNAVQ